MNMAIEADAAVVPMARQRRRHQRVDLCFKVRFRILRDEEALQTLDRIQNGAPSPSVPVPAGPAGADEDSYMQNVSNGGLGLCGQLHSLQGRLLREGDFLKLEIQHRKADGTVRCLVRVAWVEVDHDASIFRAGASFVAVNPEDLRRVGAGDLT
jgi:hypothetical protein